jgi:hypothetical protein
VGLRVAEQGGARRGRRVEVEERRAGSSSDGRFAGHEDPTGVCLPIPLRLRLLGVHPCPMLGPPLILDHVTI